MAENSHLHPEAVSAEIARLRALHDPENEIAERMKIRIMRTLAIGFYTLAIFLLCVSLPHLQSGIVRITHSPEIAAWFMAICFDLSQVWCEFALLLAPALEIRRGPVRAAWGVIIACTAVSMTLNVEAFIMNATTTKEFIYSTIFGIMLPLGVLALFYIGSAYAMHSIAWLRPRALSVVQYPGE